MMKTLNDKFVLFALVLMVLLVVACHSSRRLNDDGLTIFINSYKINCIGLEENSCLQLSRVSASPYEWETFHGKIEGFTFEEGFVYQLLVEEVGDNFKLLRVISKNEDVKLNLDGKWSVVSLKDFSIRSYADLPFIEISSSQKQIKGSDGCNSFFGNIDLVTASELKFGQIGGTKKYCHPMELANQFNALLSEVNFYQQSRNQLVFYNSQNVEILRFKRIAH